MGPSTALNFNLLAIALLFWPGGSTLATGGSLGAVLGTIGLAWIVGGSWFEPGIMCCGLIIVLVVCGAPWGNDEGLGAGAIGLTPTNCCG